MTKIAALGIFFLVVLGSFGWFGYSLVSTVVSIATHEESAVIDKGSYYLFGVGLGLAALLVDGIAANLLHKPLSPSGLRMVSRLVVFSLVLTFVLPQVLHYSIASWLRASGYTHCEGQSSTWLHVSTIEYQRSVCQAK